MIGDIKFRAYNPEKDEKAVIRIWKECGWLDLKKNRKAREAFREFLECGTADVAEFQNTAECLVSTHKGTIVLRDSDLPFRAVTDVVTGRTLRRLGIAGKLTAQTLARAAAEKDAVAGLGIFDQGFYNKLGFGNLPYIRTVTFDPLTLNVPKLRRPPIRLGLKDAPRIAASLAERRRRHGMVILPQEKFLGMIMLESEDDFGLGFEDEYGNLTHHFWAKPKSYSGPYEVRWMAYRDYDGLTELLSLMKNLGDQVHAFTLREPQGIQIQDLLQRPSRTRNITRGSLFANEITDASFKQIRILDLDAVLAALKLPAGCIRFNLELTDPITAFLPDHAPWRGVEGEWTIKLDEDGSTAKHGISPDLRTMKASINAFTRLVFGVCPAGGLAVTDDLSAPADLLDELDRKLLLPEPEMTQIY